MTAHRGAIATKRLGVRRWEAWACIGGYSWVGPVYAPTKRAAHKKAARLFVATPNRATRRAMEKLAKPK